MNKFTRSQEPHSSVYCLHTAKFLPKSSSEVNTVISMEQSLSTKVETTNASETSSDDEEVNTVFAGKKEHVISMGQSLSTKLETTNGGETNRDEEEVNTTIAGMKEHVISMGRNLSTKLETTNGGETNRDDEEVNTAIPEIEEHAIPMEQSLTKFETTEAGETSRGNEEENEHGAEWKSKAESYLRSILDNDDQLRKNKSQNFFPCPKVPPRLRQRERSKDYFDPKIVSFGPYHHGKAALQAAQMIKTKVMRNFILEHGKKIEDLYIEVRSRYGNARSCYVDGSTNSYGDEAFALMMLQDGCFILFWIEFRMYFLQDYEEWLTHRNFENLSLIFNRPDSLEIKYLDQDLLLLENQIPYSVLDFLMSNIYEENEGLTMIKSYLYRLYWGKFQKEDTRDKYEDIEDNEPHHLLGLLCTLISKRCDHVEIVPTEYVEYKNMDMDATHYLQSIGSVSDLQAKGINFKSSNYISLFSALLKEKPKSVSLRDVDFRSGFFTGELKLPPLILDSHSQVLLTNLVAFESCSTINNTFTSYFSFMNSLIANAEDVKALRSKRIILHVLDSDEEVFQMLKGIFFIHRMQDQFIYQGVRQDIERHINNKLKIWIAEMRHKYFSQPWSVISLLAAILVIILSFLQTFYTINPRKA